MRESLLGLVFLALCLHGTAQPVLNNDSIIKLVNAGLTEDVIVSTINASPGMYDASVEGLIFLKTSGASDKVIATVVQKAFADTSTKRSMESSREPLPGQTGSVAKANPSQSESPMLDASLNSGMPYRETSDAPLRTPVIASLSQSADAKVRIFVLDHSVSPSKSHYSIGAPFTAVPTDVKQPEVTQRVIEAQADILKVCPDYVVASNNQDKADYILVLGGNESARDAKVGFGGLPDVEFWDGTRVRGVSIFRMNGDMVFASRQNRIQRAIREICTRINPTK